MLERFQKRLDALKNEYAASQKAMAALDAKRAVLRDSMLRLSGAIEVIQDELDRSDGGNRSATSEIPTPVPLPSAYEIVDAEESD